MRKNNNLMTDAGKTLKGFISKAQIRCIADGLAGEESDYFANLLIRLADTIKVMPKVYEQDGLGDKAIVHLHYFRGNTDFWITEKDSEPEQLQAFGLAQIGQDCELGYINLVELTQNNVELDFHWKPKTLSEVKTEKGTA